MIKTITCPETDIQHLISALRSLDVFAKFSDHQLCKLKAKKTEASVCNFCLVRSLVFRCQSYKGRRSFKPNELLVVLKTEVLPESTTSGLLSLIQHVSSFVPNLMEYFIQNTLKQKDFPSPLCIHVCRPFLQHQLEHQGQDSTSVLSSLSRIVSLPNRNKI